MDPRYSTMDTTLKSNYDAEIQFPEHPIKSKPNLKELLEIFEQNKPPPLPQKSYLNNNNTDIPISANEMSSLELNVHIEKSKNKSKEEINKEQELQNQLSKRLQARREEQMRNFQLEQEKEEFQTKQKKIAQRNLISDTSSSSSSNGDDHNNNNNSSSSNTLVNQKLHQELQKDREAQSQNRKSQLQQQLNFIQQSPSPSPSTQQQQQLQSQQKRNSQTLLSQPQHHSLPTTPIISSTVGGQVQQVLPHEQIQQIRTISTASGLNVSMEDLIKLLKEEKVNHQQTKFLLKSVTDENSKLRNELQTWKSRFYKSSTKLQKVDIILKHFDTIMKEDTPVSSASSTPITPTSPLFNNTSSMSNANNLLKETLKENTNNVKPLSDSSLNIPISNINGGNSGSSNSGFSTISSAIANTFFKPTSERFRSKTLTSSMFKNQMNIDPSTFLQQQQQQQQPKEQQVITNGTEGLDLTEEEFLSLLEKRKVIALQVLKTEKEYAQNLSIIVDEFLTPIKSESYNSTNPFVTSVHVKQIFGDVEVILGSSNLLIEDLENFVQLSAPTGLGDVFLKVCDYFKLYSPYVNNYYTSISVLNKLKEESHRFNTFITERESSLGESNFNDLGSLLVLPVTRIGTYTNMLTELFYATPYSHPDYEPFKNSVYKMKSIVDYVKEKTREHENQNKVRLIQNSMTGKFKNLNQPHRRYTREGELPEVVNSKTSSNLLYLFLFNDILILSSKKSSSPPSYQFKKEIKLLDAEVAIINEDERPLFQISYTNPDENSNSNSSSSNNNSNSGGSSNLLLDQVLSMTGGNSNSGKDSLVLSSSSGTEKDSKNSSPLVRESIVFCADSPRDREEWIYYLIQNIAATKKISENRKQEDVLDFGKGEIDFQNSDIQLCELLGQGGSGCLVHRCTVDGFTCAVKILKLKNTQSFLIDQFVGEINLMVQLNHTNIAKYLGHRLTHNPDRLWLFMEYYPYSLKDILSKRTISFPPSEVIWMALEIAKGLDFLHSQKPPIIHRDLKPGNIMCSLDEKNRVNNIRVCDFDTSRALTPGVTLKTCIGTPCYMAAEVLDVATEGSEGYTLKADIWSFAMLIFEIISLLPPYHQFPHLNSIEMILKGTPPPLPPNLSPQLQPLIDYLLHCIDLNPSKRPNSSSLVSKLTKILKNSGKYTAQEN